MQALFRNVVYFASLVMLNLISSCAHAQIRDWNSASGLWYDASNWNPNIVPGMTDLARIGLLPAANEARVGLNGNALVSGLQLFNGAQLQTNGNDMQTVFDTLVTGTSPIDSELVVENSVYGTRDFTNEARIRLAQGTLNVSRFLNNTGLMFGEGVVNLARASGIALSNDGTIFVSSFENSGPNLTINQLSGGLIDLDGATGNGFVRVRETGSSLTINATQLADSFSGILQVNSSATLNMNLSSRWTADSNSEINFVGRNGEIARIQGSDWNLNGTLNAVSHPTHGVVAASIEAPVEIGNTASVFVEGGGNELTFAPVTVNGGNFVLGQGAELTFASNTLLRGGTFSTHSQLSSDGAVRFDGLTVWEGDVSVTGVALQNGNAIVSGATVINAGILDMDGSGNTNWNVSSALTINADGIDSTISNSFDGSIYVSSGLESQLTVNLDQPGESWTMAGEMSLENPLNVGLNRVLGSAMRLTGELDLDGRVGIAADFHADNSAMINFADPETLLFVSGSTLVEQGASFVGTGTLSNSPSGDLTLANGASLNDIELENYGVFNVSMETGIADVAEFHNLSDAVIEVDLGGYNIGSERDLLLVGLGGAHLDGLLQVDLIDSGSGLFLPSVNDEFTFLLSTGGILGTFANDPVSFANGQSYFWEVNYNPNDVTLRLASISVPEPSVWGAASLFSLVFLTQRRRIV